MKIKMFELSILFMTVFYFCSNILNYLKIVIKMVSIFIRLYFCNFQNMSKYSIFSKTLSLTDINAWIFFPCSFLGWFWIVKRGPKNSHTKIWEAMICYLYRVLYEENTGPPSTISREFSHLMPFISPPLFFFMLQKFVLFLHWFIYILPIVITKIHI